MAKKGEVRKGILTRVYEAILNFFGRGPPKKTPVPGIGRRLKNIVKYHMKGILGCLVPICALSWQFERFNNSKKVEIMWLWMFWFFLLRPVHIPVTGLIPVFFLPMTGSISTQVVTSLYSNDNIQFLILGGMTLLLLNNSGADRRIGLYILTAGKDPAQYSSKRLVYKCSLAAYLLSMFSNRLVVTSMLTEYVTQIFEKAEVRYSQIKDEAKLKRVRFIVNNAIQTSSTIGSIGILNAAYTPIAFRSIFCESADTGKEYADIINFLQYSAFAIPVSLVMYVVNILYHMILVNSTGTMSKQSRTFVKDQFAEKKAQLPKAVSKHEKFTHVFLILSLALHFSRWNEWFGGWAKSFPDKLSTDAQYLPRAKDSTSAAIIVILVHLLPYNFHFLKYISAEKRKDLPPAKPESTVLWFRFVDKNVNYGYFFVIGAGNALMVASQRTGLCTAIAQGTGTNISGKDWMIGILIICALAVLLGNSLCGMAACALIVPYVMCMALGGPAPWPKRAYLAGLAAGLGTNFGFVYPFLYSPAYFCHYVGKVPAMKIFKYSIFTSISCLIILWLAIVLYANVLWTTDLKAIGEGTTTPEPEI